MSDNSNNMRADEEVEEVAEGLLLATLGMLAPMTFPYLPFEKVFSYKIFYIQIVLFYEEKMTRAWRTQSDKSVIFFLP